MEQEIIKYLSKYVSITEEVKKAIIDSSLIKRYKKGTLLLKEGDISNESFLVLKGCIRSYYLLDGKERITAFYTEEHVVSPVSYGKNVPSEQYLECNEDTIASVGTPTMETDMFKRFPAVESICRVLTEVFLTRNQELFDDYVIASPEERYLKLVATRPELIQRVPQHQIASYLGIKPESLSRIRKRMMNRQK